MTHRWLFAMVACGSLVPMGLLAGCDDLGLAATPVGDASTSQPTDATADSPSSLTDGSNADGNTGKDSGGGDGGIDFGSCADAAGTSTCNPASGSGCNLGAGATCDYDPPNGNFKCYSDGQNVGDICAACDPSTGKLCKPGSTCSPDGICVRYCCSNADCKGHGNCALPGPFDLPGIGICFDEVDQLCATDAGTDAPVDAPSDGG